MTDDDAYPPTLWSQIREVLLVALLLVAPVVAVLGLVLGSAPLATSGAVLAGIAVALILPVLYLEYRADMKHDRAGPPLGGE